MKRLTFSKADEYLENLTNKEMRLLLQNYKSSKKEIDKLIENLKTEYSDTWFSMPQYKRLKAIKDQVNDTINTLIRVTNPIIYKGEEKHYIDSYKITDQTFSKTLKIELSFTMLDKQAIVKAIKNPLTEVSSIQRNTQNLKQLKTELTQNLITGKSYRDTAKKVSERFNVAVYKADRIVRTENHRVQLEARLDSMKDAKSQGIQMMKEWVSASDSRTRSSHLELNGTIIPVDANFVSSTGGIGPAPGQMGGSDDINCRCSIAAVID
jgi:SPP1 gp7 family putative phage head morphogenesis protein